MNLASKHYNTFLIGDKTMPRRINKSECVGCGTCQRVCIVG
ncbi:4Fe-4S binding protein [Clostridium sardiniense]|nr:ferredoxin [Clostridium sardiniense]